MVQSTNSETKPLKNVIWSIFKVSLTVGFVVGAAYTILIGISVFSHPSVDNDPGIFSVVIPFIFLLAAVPAFAVTALICLVRRAYINRRS